MHLSVSVLAHLSLSHSHTHTLSLPLSDKLRMNPNFPQSSLPPPPTSNITPPPHRWVQRKNLLEGFAQVGREGGGKRPETGGQEDGDVGRGVGPEVGPPGGLGGGGGGGADVILPRRMSDMKKMLNACQSSHDLRYRALGFVWIPPMCVCVCVCVCV